MWAFLAENAARDVAQQLGREVDRLDSKFNAGLHSQRDRNRLESCFADLALVLRDILMVNPEAARKPYYEHQAKMMQFFKRSRSAEEDDGRNT